MELDRELRRKEKALAELAALITLQKKSRPSGGTRATAQARRTRRDPWPTRRSRHGRRTARAGLRRDRPGRAHGAAVEEARRRRGSAHTSFSRPSVSNDNPLSESAFRTAKYRPEYPVRPFESLEAARAWARRFVRWYNEEHLHSSIRFVTPSDRHEGHERSILAAREQVYDTARERRPDRWSRGTRNWAPVRDVTLNPAPESEGAHRGANRSPGGGNYLDTHRGREAGQSSGA